MKIRAVPWLLLLAIGTLGAEPAARADTHRSGAKHARLEARVSVPAAESKQEGVERELAELGRWVARENGELSAEIVELESGRVLAARGANIALNPASTTKVLTAAAALSKLGVDYRFTTGVYGTIKDGVATRIVLRSNGDPSLRARDLGELAQKLKDKGLTRVTGDILVDQNAFDDKFVPPAFDQQPHEWAAFRAPVSAVSVDRNSFVIRVFPDQAAKRARITLEPSGYVEVLNELSLEDKSKARKFSIEMLPEGSKLKIRIKGRLGASAPSVSFQRRVDDPRLFAGYVLKSALNRVGVSVDGSVSEGGKDEKHVLIEHGSEPLSVLVRELGKNSDNFYAETLLKALAAKTNSRPGSSADGTAAVTDWLKQHGADTSNLRLVNGSGLFDANRVSATLLASAVVSAYKDSRISSAFVDQLAQAGVDGTLRTRLGRLKMRQNVHAKTGTLARVHALAGVILPPSGRSPVAFAILVNGIAGKQDEQRRRIDRVVEAAAVDLWR